MNKKTLPQLHIASNANGVTRTASTVIEMKQNHPERQHLIIPYDAVIAFSITQCIPNTSSPGSFMLNNVKIVLTLSDAIR